MDAGTGLECRLTDLEDLFELDMLREKIKCAHTRNSCFVRYVAEQRGMSRQVCG